MEFVVMSDVKNEKTKNITLPINLMRWFLLGFIAVTMFFPTYFEPMMPFLTPFSSVIRVIYAIVATLVSIVAVVGIVAIILITYTDKLNNNKKEPDVPQYGPLWKTVLSWIEDIAFIYLTWSAGWYYISVLVTIQLLWGMTYKFIEKDFISKMLKLKLAWQEPEPTAYEKLLANINK